MIRVLGGKERLRLDAVISGLTQLQSADALGFTNPAKLDSIIDTALNNSRQSWLAKTFDKLFARGDSKEDLANLYHFLAYPWAHKLATNLVVSDHNSVDVVANLSAGANAIMALDSSVRLRFALDPDRRNFVDDPTTGLVRHQLGELVLLVLLSGSYQPLPNAAQQADAGSDSEDVGEDADDADAGASNDETDQSDTVDSIDMSKLVKRVMFARTPDRAMDLMAEADVDKEWSLEMASYMTTTPLFHFLSLVVGLRLDSKQSSKTSVLEVAEFLAIHSAHLDDSGWLNTTRIAEVDVEKTTVVGFALWDFRKNSESVELLQKLEELVSSRFDAGSSL